MHSFKKCITFVGRTKIRNSFNFTHEKTYFFRRLVVVACAALSMAVMAQSTNNDDGVVKLDTRFRHNDARPGEVLVKFKDQNPVTILTHYGIVI